jgi:uncharacterized protein
LKLNLKTLEAGTSKVVLQVKKEDIDPAIARLSADGRLELTVINEPAKIEEYICVAALSAVVSLECARCLKEITCPVETGFSFTLREGRGPADEDSDENLVFFDPREDEVDIAQLVIDEISVEIPMQPLCKEDCEGLCVECGANLNEKKCSCRAETVNPAWDALKKLKGE